jgi:hypothetical protein
MTQHFTRNTVSAEFYCGKCGKFTQHEIWDRRKGACIPCKERLEKLHNVPKPEPDKQMGLFAATVAVLLLSLPSFAQADFWTVATLAMSATAADSYYTGQFQRNYQAWYTWRGPQGAGNAVAHACMTESGEPFLYGRHPGEFRAWSVGAGKVAAAMSVSLWARKRKSLRRLAGVPLWILAADSSVGAVRNVLHCGL